nr:M15 family metallopeptidase [uncultured Oscillibacter sp.]
MRWSRFAAGLLAGLMLLSSAAWAAEPEKTPAEDARDTVEETADWRLLLVNPWNSLPEDFTVELQTLSNGMKVDERIVEDLNAMLADCRKAGLRPRICSAYRPLETQTRLYNNKIARLRAAGYSREAAVKEAGRWVAVPGTSEHQTGLALDIVAADYQVLDKRQEETAEQKWLMEHCWEYGFILRYPSDKSEITGIGYEPWHYRYVGREAALAIRDSGLCFEEYLQSLEAEDAKAEPETEQETKQELKKASKQETAKAASCFL